MKSDVKITVLLADDHHLFRAGVKKILDVQNNISVAGEAENGAQLITKYFTLNPDVVLVDISMPVLSGTEAVKSIISKDPMAKALFLSMYDSEDYLYLCFAAGGLGLINKNSLEDELVKAITKVSKGEKYFGKNYPEQKLNELRIKFESANKQSQGADITVLTNREKEILELIGDGLTSSEIADKINLSIRTIETHRSNLIHKLNINSLSELIKFAIEFNLKNKGE